MGAATSPEMAAVTLVMLPPTLISMILRFWIRVERRAWGADDWAMVATIPFWLVSQIGMLGMAWSGVGILKVTPQQSVDSLYWFYIFQEPWCFTLVTLKWCLGFTLLRIADKPWVKWIIHVSLALVTLCTGGTGIYLFFQCSPVQKNWHPELAGECKPREIQTALSFLVAAVSITTDWVFAVLPCVLLWNLQMSTRVKISVIGLLSLGFFASVAPIVRLSTLLALNDQEHFFEGLGTILTWAWAEVGIGMLVANLPACRPFLERGFAFISGSSRNGKTTTGRKYGDVGDPESGTSALKSSNYVELGEREVSRSISRSGRGQGHDDADRYGIETRVYGRDGTGGGSTDSLTHDDQSRKHIVKGKKSGGFGAVHVQRQIAVTHSPAQDSIAR